MLHHSIFLSVLTKKKDENAQWNAVTGEKIEKESERDRKREWERKRERKRGNMKTLKWFKVAHRMRKEREWKREDRGKKVVYLKLLHERRTRNYYLVQDGPKKSLWCDLRGKVFKKF